MKIPAFTVSIGLDNAGQVYSNTIAGQDMYLALRNYGLGSAVAMVLLEQRLEPNCVRDFAAFPKPLCPLLVLIPSFVFALDFLRSRAMASVVGGEVRHLDRGPFAFGLRKSAAWPMLEPPALQATLPAPV